MRTASPFTASLLVVASCLLAGTLAAEQPAGCQTVNATSAHDQIIKLSNILDPSGKLSKMIADFHPHRGHGAPGADPMQAAASELEPVKREVDPSTASGEPAAAAAAAAPQAAPAAPAANTTLSGLISSATAATAIAAETTTAAPSAQMPVGKAAEAPATQAPQVVAKSAESKNVTVNVFLQLAPDAKTDELVSARQSSLTLTHMPLPLQTVERTVS